MNNLAQLCLVYFWISGATHLAKFPGKTLENGDFLNLKDIKYCGCRYSCLFNTEGCKAFSFMAHANGSTECLLSKNLCDLNAGMEDKDGSLLICLSVCTQELEEPKNAVTTWNSPPKYVLGSTFTITCNPNHKTASGETALTVECGADGWSKYDDCLQATVCPPLPDLVKAESDYSSTKIYTDGTSVTVTCLDGYKFYGSGQTERTISCAGGNWDTVEPCSKCEENFNMVGSLCLSLVKKSLTFSGAKEHCEKFTGGRLAQFKTSTEANNLIIFLKSKDFVTWGYTLWIGGTKENTEDLWKWTDGSKFAEVDGVLTWSKYKGLMKPSGGNSKNCMTIKRGLSFDLHDSNCDTKFYFICETKIQ